MDDTKTLIELMVNINTGLIVIDNKHELENHVEINTNVVVLHSNNDQS